MAKRGRKKKHVVDLEKYPLKVGDWVKINKSGFAVFELSQFFNKQKISSIFKNFSNIEFYKDINNNLRAIKISND